MEETDEIAQIYNKHRLPSLSGLSKVSAFIHRADIGGVLNVSEQLDKKINSSTKSI